MTTQQEGAAPLRLTAMIGVTFFIMFGFGLVVPTLPLFTRSLGVREAGIGLVLTVFAAMRLAGSLVTAPVLRRLGERWTAAAGAGIVGASSLSAGFSTSYGMLVVLRGAGGIGSAFFLGAIMSALLGGVEPSRRGRAMGAFQGAVLSGFVVGPAFGGLVGRISLRAPLYIYGIICLVAAPAMAAVMRRERTGMPAALDADAALTPEESPPPPALPGWRQIRPLLRDSAYRAALAAGFASFFVAGGMDTLMSLTWNERLDQPASSVGIPFMVLAIAGLFPTFHAGRLADARGRRFATIPALAASAPLIVGFGLVHSAAAFIVLSAMLGIAWGYQRPGPSAIVGDVTTDASRAVGIGALRIANDVGALVGPVLAGAIAQSAGRTAGYAVAAAGSAFALIFMLAARETNVPSVQT